MFCSAVFCLFINYAHLLTQAHFLITRLGIMCFITPRAKKKTHKWSGLYLETAGNLCASRAKQNWMFCFCVGSYNKTQAEKDYVKLPFIVLLCSFLGPSVQSSTLSWAEMFFNEISFLLRSCKLLRSVMCSFENFQLFLCVFRYSGVHHGFFYSKCKFIACEARNG